MPGKSMAVRTPHTPAIPSLVTPPYTPQRLRGRFGVAPYNLPGTVPSKELPVPLAHPTDRYQRMAVHYEAAMGAVGYWDRWPNWDMHPFGVWLADASWPKQVRIHYYTNTL